MQSVFGRVEIAGSFEPVPQDMTNGFWSGLFPQFGAGMIERVYKVRKQPNAHEGPSAGRCGTSTFFCVIAN